MHMVGPLTHGFLRSGSRHGKRRALLSPCSSLLRDMLLESLTAALRVP
jgi:hypothetical protein